MTSRLASFGFTISRAALVVAAAALVATSKPARGGELCIPPGYFNGSGGYYSYDCNSQIIDRYAVAPGCGLPASYRATYASVFAPVPVPGAAISWYRGDTPAYCNGPRRPVPPCPVPIESTPCLPEPIFPGETESQGTF